MFRLASTTLRSAARRYSTAPAAPVTPTKKVGAFRGGFVGFFFGVSAYNKNTQIVMTDVLSLKESLNALEKHVRTLDEQKK
ncbi:hypothetical protein CA3LBN_002768 [Candidozyma haemuli]|uniref:Uncharacterized protein n=1 Tax=Candidozyma haemuli TaxID=45357 RepID=A0ABX8I998_9ASCO|nr:hypothetical protein CA3LBN_002768 [[Candida] haemuloni]